MKKTILTSMLLATFALSAQESSPVVITTPSFEAVSPRVDKKISEKSKSFFYVKMSAADSHPTDSVQVVPGIGLGYRLSADSSAVDFSASYVSGTGNKGSSKAFFYALPKVTYLRYLSPLKAQSFYGGLGAAWGKIKTKDQRRFEGIIPNATVGYEMNRNDIVKTFVQLEVSQPAIAQKTSGSFVGPIAEVSVGAGF